MKRYELLTIFFILILSISCKKNCNQENEVCNESAPKNELCQAYFERWFYNPRTNSCEKIGYSGCSAKGFETKQECEECKCR